MTKENAGRGPADAARVDPATELFHSLRASGLPLNEQLARLSEAMEASDPAYAKAYDQLVARLKRAHAGKDAPQKGEQMPAFLLPDEEGHLVSMATLLESGPLIIAFLRGHWCPYCRLNAIALAGLESAIRPTRIVVICPETAQFSKSLRDESGADFRFLSDVGNGYALSIGLAFALGEDLSAMLYADQCDIPSFNGTAGWFLPMPAVFVVGRDGLVHERHVNPDFRQRMEIDALRIAAVAASTQNT
ncbi:MAG TPA: peroxiredoxin-like family protein [Sphingorhabdus sp.]|jgi:peroxiredoxin|nr:peroxiredoxin-like family protein [Sphingorhabdus sp.]